MLDHDGDVRGTYDKAHLVPFGEYVPFHTLLANFGIEKITAGSVDLSAGPGPRTLHLPGLPPVGPLICYEGIFPGAVIDPDDRPAWLLNISNDGWYGLTAPAPISISPSAEAMPARSRTALPMVRAANTGVSGVVDAWGRVTRPTWPGRSCWCMLDTSLPVGIGAGDALCSGSVIFRLLIAISAILLWAGIARRLTASA